MAGNNLFDALCGEVAGRLTEGVRGACIWCGEVLKRGVYCKGRREIRSKEHHMQSSYPKA
jgi:hypothetical protein